MEKSKLIPAMRQFCFGAKVFCADGGEAYLTALGFDREKRELVAIAVRMGRFFGRTAYVPFARVVEATSSGIRLNLTGEQLLACRKECSGGAWLDGRSAVVNTATSTQGRLALVAVDPESGALSYIVAHHLRHGQDTRIDADSVTSIESNQIMISLPASTLQDLPPYIPDEALKMEVERILFEVVPLHVDFHAICLHVSDSVLYLSGNISSTLRGDIVADQVLNVPGLLAVENHLIGDDLLAANVAAALGRDPRTHGLPIGVYPRLGIVRLSGFVRTAKQKAAAEEITSNQVGVRGVENDLVVKSSGDLLNVLAATAGSESQDHVPGKYVRHTK